MTPRAEAALYYAVELGWQVVPLRIKSKIPATRHGCLDASSDPAQVRAWWEERPWGNVGVRCGKESGLLVVDLDGVEAAARFQRLEDEHGFHVETLEQRTGRLGGRHLVYAYPPGAEIGNSAGGVFGPGIDVRGTNGYIVCAPSIHPNGRMYAWVWPDWCTRTSGNGNAVPGPPTARQWTIPRQPAQCPPFIVERLLETRPRAKATALTVQPAPIPAGLPRHLRARASEASGTDRSDQTYALVLAALEYGLSDSQTLALALAHQPTREKYGTRAAAEVEAILGKVRPNHDHVGQPCDRAHCPRRPDWMR